MFAACPVCVPAARSVVSGQKEARRRAEGAAFKELANSYNVRRATISKLDQ
jgi:hypothetical protein